MQGRCQAGVLLGRLHNRRRGVGHSRETSASRTDEACNLGRQAFGLHMETAAPEDISPSCVVGDRWRGRVLVACGDKTLTLCDLVCVFYYVTICGREFKRRQIKGLPEWSNGSRYHCGTRGTGGYEIRTHFARCKRNAGRLRQNMGWQ